jgi:ribulose-phosphate 3-epimerase
MPKLARLADAIHDAGLDVWLQVDGGITAETIGMAAEAGADTFVAGSAVFNGEVPADRIASLRASAAAHPHFAGRRHR